MGISLEVGRGVKEKGWEGNSPPETFKLKKSKQLLCRDRLSYLQRSALPAVMESEGIAGDLVSAVARSAGRGRTVPSATVILAACMAPAIVHGSVFARKAGAACCAMKVSQF